MSKASRRRNKKRQQQKKRARIEESVMQIEEAEQLAMKYGLHLRRCEVWHWQLRDLAAGWCVNLYPSTQTIYVDVSHAKPPDVHVHGYWTVFDVVRCYCREYEDELAEQLSGRRSESERVESESTARD